MSLVRAIVISNPAIPEIYYKFLPMLILKGDHIYQKVSKHLFNEARVVSVRLMKTVNFRISYAQRLWDWSSASRDSFISQQHTRFREFEDYKLICHTGYCRWKDAHFQGLQNSPVEKNKVVWKSRNKREKPPKSTGTLPIGLEGRREIQTDFTAFFQTFSPSTGCEYAMGTVIWTLRAWKLT